MNTTPPNLKYVTANTCVYYLMYFSTSYFTLIFFNNELCVLNNDFKIYLIHTILSRVLFICFQLLILSFYHLICLDTFNNHIFKKIIFMFMDKFSKKNYNPR